MTQGLLVTWLQVRPSSDLEHVCYGGGNKCLKGSMCMCLSYSSSRTLCTCVFKSTCR